MGALLNDLSRSELAALDVIRERGQVTRGEVGQTIGLSQAMIARLVARLQEIGLVREAGRSVVDGPGRQALLLELHPDAAYVAGVDIGVDTLRVVVTNLHCRVLAARELPSSTLADKSQEAIIATIADSVRAVAQEAAIRPEQLAVVGVAVTGIVDSDNGVCLVRSTTPGWEHFPIADLLGEALGVPVELEETARAKSLAELRLGAARGVQHFLYVEVGTTIGASIVINRQPFRGVGGLAGELGHVTVDPDGMLCRCGNRGCIQTSASAQALIGQARHLLGQGVYSTLTAAGETLTLADIARAADTGDKVALGLFNEAGERLGDAISMALNLLGLDLVVMGGRLAQCSPVVMDAARRTVRLRVLPIIPQERRLVYSTLGDDVAALGVALQAIDWLFLNPLERLRFTLARRDGEAMPETNLPVASH